MRTHASAMVVNRESRFYRSAGLENLELSTTTTGTQLLSSSPVAAAKCKRGAIIRSTLKFT